MVLYVTRHGQTAWNNGDKICGRTDVDLNDTGIRQAEALAESIHNQNIKLDLIIASPMKRTMQTAEIIARVNSVNIITDERIIEQCYGIYEGAGRHDEGFLNNKRQFAFKYPGGESMMQVAQRVYNFLDEIKELYKGKTLLLVSHGGTLRVLNTYFEDMTNDGFFRWQLNNAELRRYELE